MSKQYFEYIGTTKNSEYEAVMSEIANCKVHDTIDNSSKYFMVNSFVLSNIILILLKQTVALLHHSNLTILYSGYKKIEVRGYWIMPARIF